MPIHQNDNTVRYPANNIHVFRHLIILSFLFFPAYSYGTAETDLFPVTGKRWTFAFYLAGENSLEADQVRNLKEICTGSGSLDNINLVVFFDRDDDTTHENILTSWKGTRVFHVKGTYRDTIKRPIFAPLPHSIEHGRLRYILAKPRLNEDDRAFIDDAYTKRQDRYYLKDLTVKDKAHLRTLLTEKALYLLPLEKTANLDASRGETLRQFMSLVKDNFISEYYALYITGHSIGWFSGYPLPARPSNPHSDEYYRAHDIRELKKALYLTHCDALTLDTCYMGDIETAWSLKDCTRYLAVNQTAIPSMGLDYSILIKTLHERASFAPRDVIYETIEAYRQTYQKKMYPISSSAIDLGEDFQTFVKELQAYVKDDRHLHALIRGAGQSFHIPSRAYNKGKMADLFSLTDHIGQGNTIAPLRRGKFIINRFSIHTKARGISIYLPRTKQILGHDYNRYRLTDYSKDFPEGWVRVLPRILD